MCMQRIIEVVERFVLCVGCIDGYSSNIHNRLIDVHEMFYGLLHLLITLSISRLDRMPQLMTMNDVDWFFFPSLPSSLLFFGSCNFIKMLSVKRGKTLFTPLLFLDDYNDCRNILDKTETKLFPRWLIYWDTAL